MTVITDLSIIDLHNKLIQHMNNIYEREQLQIELIKKKQQTILKELRNLKNQK